MGIFHCPSVEENAYHVYYHQIVVTLKSTTFARKGLAVYKKINVKQTITAQINKDLGAMMANVLNAFPMMNANTLVQIWYVLFREQDVLLEVRVALSTMIVLMEIVQCAI